MNWLLTISIISIVLLIALPFVLYNFEDFAGPESFGHSLLVSFAVFMFIGIIPTVLGSVEFNKLDPSTAKYRTGTVEDLVGAKQTGRDCTPGDNKFTVVTGMTNDVSFWVGNPPRPYKEVLICKYP